MAVAVLDEFAALLAEHTLKHELPNNVIIFKTVSVLVKAVKRRSAKDKIRKARSRMFQVRGLDSDMS